MIALFGNEARRRMAACHDDTKRPVGASILKKALSISCYKLVKENDFHLTEIPIAHIIKYMGLFGQIRRIAQRLGAAEDAALQKAEAIQHQRSSLSRREVAGVVQGVTRRRNGFSRAWMIADLAASMHQAQVAPYQLQTRPANDVRAPISTTIVSPLQNRQPSPRVARAVQQTLDVTRGPQTADRQNQDPNAKQRGNRVATEEGRSDRDQSAGTPQKEDDLVQILKNAGLGSKQAQALAEQGHQDPRLRFMLESFAYQASTSDAMRVTLRGLGDNAARLGKIAGRADVEGARVVEQAAKQDTGVISISEAAESLQQAKVAEATGRPLKVDTHTPGNLFVGGMDQTGRSVALDRNSTHIDHGIELIDTTSPFASNRRPANENGKSIGEKPPKVDFSSLAAGIANAEKAHQRGGWISASTPDKKHQQSAALAA